MEQADELNDLLTKLEKPANQIKDLLDNATVDQLVDVISKGQEELAAKYIAYNHSYMDQEKRIERLRVDLENIWEESDKMDKMLLKFESLLNQNGMNLKKLKDMRR